MSQFAKRLLAATQNPLESSDKRGVHEKIKEANKNREGKSALNVHLDPIPNSVYLGNGNVAHISRGVLYVESFNVIKGVFETARLNLKEAKHLTKIL